MGECGACWLVPLLVGLVGAGWFEALGAGWPWVAGIGLLVAGALVLGRRVQPGGSNQRVGPPAETWLEPQECPRERQGEPGRKPRRLQACA